MYINFLTKKIKLEKKNFGLEYNVSATTYMHTFTENIANELTLMKWKNRCYPFIGSIRINFDSSLRRAFLAQN